MAVRVEFIEAPQTYALRHAVLRPHMTLKDCEYPGDFAAGTLHVGAFVDGQLVTILSAVAENSPLFSEQLQYRFRAMATHPDFHRRGLAAQVVEFITRDIAARGAQLIWFNAREAAFGFYEKMGFAYKGDMFEIAGVGPHKVMFKSLV